MSPLDVKPYKAKESERLKTPDFKALVLKSKPIPQLYSKVDDEELKIRSIQEWEDQVTKYVGFISYVSK